jgi:hypothetical protein
MLFLTHAYTVPIKYIYARSTYAVQCRIVYCILIRAHRKKEYASLVGYILILMGGLSQPNPD